jgi:uncharacterized protein YndB with AHSA1/START domain
MTEDKIEREVVIDAPVERVWALITQAEHLGAWFGDAGAEIDLREGGELELRWEDYGTSRGQIERLDEPTAFSFRWAPFQDPGGVEPTDGNSTLVEFTLAAEGDGTRLHVAESGFDGLATTDAARARAFAGNREGWEIETGELRDYAERIAVR